MYFRKIVLCYGKLNISTIYRICKILKYLLKVKFQPCFMVIENVNSLTFVAQKYIIMSGRNTSLFRMVLLSPYCVNACCQFETPFEVNVLSLIDTKQIRKCEILYFQCVLKICSN